MIQELPEIFDEMETSRRLKEFGEWWDELESNGFDWEDIEQKETKFEIWRIQRELFDGDLPDSPDNHDPIN